MSPAPTRAGVWRSCAPLSAAHHLRGPSPTQSACTGTPVGSSHRFIAFVFAVKFTCITGVHYPSGGYRRINSANAAACAVACRNDPRCRSYEAGRCVRGACVRLRRDGARRDGATCELHDTNVMSYTPFDHPQSTSEVCIDKAVVQGQCLVRSCLFYCYTRSCLGTHPRRLCPGTCDATPPAVCSRT